MPQYEVLEVLGRGGMGVVYKATDNVLHRTVAIKVFHENLVQQEVVIKRFLRESNISAQLDHPYIVKVYSFERQAGQSFLVMECIQGKPLLQYIEEKQLSLEGKLEILAKVANALHYAHRKKIIHRDIKPSNIMVRTNGEPVVMDFGIAKCIGLDELTRTGEFLGTIQYVSPEQAEGKRRELDHRTDVYSLGAVMYHLLVGKPPVEATTFNEMLYQLAYENPTPPQKIDPNIPLAVTQICLKALAKDKEQRYTSAQEFSDDIQNYLSGKKIKATRWAKQQFWKHWILRSMLGLGIVIFLIGLAWGGYYYSQQQKIDQTNAALAEQVRSLQMQLENRKLWQFDRSLWEQVSQNTQKAYDFYQENQQWVNDQKLIAELFNYRIQCTYKLGIHQWVEDPLQSINAFSEIVGISLPEQQQMIQTQLAVLAANIHLQYLSHNDQAVCDSFSSFVKLSTPIFTKSNDLLSAYPEVAFLVAKSHYHCQRYEDAQKYLQVLSDNQHFMAHNKIKAEVLYYQGMCQYHQDQYHEALENFKEAKTAWQTYNHPVDFGIYLLIYLGDCQSQLVLYSEKLSSSQRWQLEEVLRLVAQEEKKLPPRTTERALYYELKARCLLSPIEEKDPEEDQIRDALDMVSQSSQILPCRYTQHLLRGIALRYQAKSNFHQYHHAWKEFIYAAQLNPHQPDSVAFIMQISSEYLNHSRDQVTDFIVQLQNWNTHMENVSTDFYGHSMKQLELQCNGQLQKFVGIPYQERLVEKFYNDLASPIASIRQLARSSLIDLVSYKDGIANHQFTYTYLEEKRQKIANHTPLYSTLSSILDDITAQEAKEAAWQHLYFLARIPYRGTIPDIVLEECNKRPGMICFLMNMLLEHPEKMLPELQSSGPWLQYLAARVLVQLPYPLDNETLKTLSQPPQSASRYARKILYDMITSPAQKQSLSEIFCLSVAKALKDARFVWWDRSLIFKWWNVIWPQLQRNDQPDNMWLQTNIASLLSSSSDQQARNLLANLYQKTRYNLVKAFIVHELPENESLFLADTIIQDFSQWLPQPKNESPEILQLRILNILNTPVICQYITHKYESQMNHPTQAQKLDQEYKKLVTQLSTLLVNQEENIKIHKAIMAVVLLSWHLNDTWYVVNQNSKAAARIMSKLLNSTDQETRLLAIATIPLIGNQESLQEINQKALDSSQPFVEKLALFYGILNGVSKSDNVKAYQHAMQAMLTFIQKAKEQKTSGWILALLCHFQYYLEGTMRDTTLVSFVRNQIVGYITENLKSDSPGLLIWTLMSITRINEFSPRIYNQISTLFREGKFSAPMIEMLALGVLIHLSMKNNLPNDCQQWMSLGYEKLKDPQFRPYLSILVWGYLQTMRNNEVSFQLHGKVLIHEEEVEIQDLYWLRYQKSLIDPHLCHYAEVCLSAALQVFAKFADNLTISEQEQLQQVELMLAELYYHDGRMEQANQFLEQNKKHLTQLPLAMLWAEHNPHRIHEIWPTWNAKYQEMIQQPQQSTMPYSALFMRLTAMQHQQEKQCEQMVQDLTEAALLESRAVKSWILLFDAMLDKQPNQAKQMIDEAKCAGFYQSRIIWARIQYCAKYLKPDKRYSNIHSLLCWSAVNWEYPITLQMLKALECPNIPSGEICYALACNHAHSRWHYEACYWLKEAAKYDYKLQTWQIQQDILLFKKYKTKKYQVYDAQAAIEKLFESK